MSDSRTPGSAVGFRQPEESGRYDRFRRSGCNGRRYLHGRSGKILYELYTERILRKVRALPRRYTQNAGDSGKNRCRKR